MPSPHAFGPKQSKSTGLFPPPPDPHHSPYARSAQHPDHVKPSHFFGWKLCSCNIFLGSFGCFFYLNQRWSSRIWARSRHEHHNNIFFQGSKRHIQHPSTKSWPVKMWPKECENCEDVKFGGKIWFTFIDLAQKSWLKPPCHLQHFCWNEYTTYLNHVSITCGMCTIWSGRCRKDLIDNSCMKLDP